MLVLLIRYIFLQTAVLILLPFTSARGVRQTVCGAPVGAADSGRGLAPKPQWAHASAAERGQAAVTLTLTLLCYQVRIQPGRLPAAWSWPGGTGELEVPGLNQDARKSTLR